MAANELDVMIAQGLETSRRIEQGMDEVKAGIEAVLAEHKRMRELLRWLRQTFHQAHHDGEIKGCQKNTCSAITATLNDVPERP